MNFHHERRAEVKNAFHELETGISAIRLEIEEIKSSVNLIQQGCNFRHGDKNNQHETIFGRLKAIEMKVDGDGNGNEGLIRKMDALKNVPDLIRSNTNTMRWTIGIMVAANLGMFSAIITIANHKP